MVERHPRGTGDMRIAIKRATESLAHTRSELEDRFRTLILGANLPTPQFNAAIELDETTTIQPDVAWLDHKVLVELDGWQAHGTRQQFAEDRRRDRAAQLAGWNVLRYTWSDLDARATRELERLLSGSTERRSGRPRSGAPRA